MHPQGATGMAPPSINDYGRLLTQALKLFDNDEGEAKLFLDTQLLRAGVDPEKLNWDWRQVDIVANSIAELLKATPRKPRKKKEQPVLDLLSGFSEGTDGACIVEEATGEVMAQSEQQKASEQDEITAAAREALGFDKLERLIIDSEHDRDRRLKQRMEISAKLDKLKENYEEARKHYQSELDSWNHLFLAQVEAWERLHPPKKGRTTYTPFGQLSFRAVPESIALNTELDRDESLQQGWLHQRNDKEKEEFEIQPKTVYGRNLDKIKAFFHRQIAHYQESLAAWQAKQKETPEKDLSAERPKFPELPRWLRYTPKHDSFSIKH